jgi:peptidoglycan/LPS O-acetylase OafA/YrhL
LFYGLLQDYTSSALLGLPQTWSLSVEVSFYVALPAFAALMTVIARSRRWLAFEVLVLGAMAVAGILIQTRLGFYGIVGTLDWFAVGMLLAAASEKASEGDPLAAPLRALASRPTLCWGLALASFAAVCWLESAGASGDWGYFVKTVGYSVTAGLLLIPATLSTRANGLPKRLLDNRLAVWLGTVSYGIFLYHLPVLILIQRWGWSNVVLGRPVLSYTVLGLALTIPLAAASWYLIERPALRLKPGAGRRAIAPILESVPEGIAMPLVESAAAPDAAPR